VTQSRGEALELDLGRTALLLLDYQNYNVHPDGYWASVTPGLVERVAPALARAAEALAAAREAGIHVVHVQNAWREGHPDINPHTPWQADAKAAGRSTEGSWGIEFFEPLAPTGGELVVRKRAVSGFAGTELDRLLRIHDVSTVVIAGIVTNFAAEGTARDASDRGYRVVVLGDCCESITDEMHTFALTQILPILGEVVGAEDFARAVGHS
jgi:nicotinamidase-related amidase